MRYATSLLVFLIVLSEAVTAQEIDTLKLSFRLKNGSKDVCIASSKDGNKMDGNRMEPKIEVLKCYISKVQLWDAEKMVYAESNSFHLLDAEEQGSLAWSLSIPAGLHFSTIQFHVGIDSATNVAGAFGGDLDPTKGMFWTWQSGYINFKLEGTAMECPARNNYFQFHIGGYQGPFASIQTVRLPASKSEHISIVLDASKVLDQIDLGKEYQIMSPSERSLAFAKLLPTLFSSAP